MPDHNCSAGAKPICPRAAFAHMAAPFLAPRFFSGVRLDSTKCYNITIQLAAQRTFAKVKCQIKQASALHSPSTIT
jgi:hypothetical protein